MTESDTGRALPTGGEAERKTGISPEAEKDSPGKPDAETQEAAKEAIDRATAAVGHDDGKR